MKKFKAAVIGGTGYGGVELIRRLMMHPDVELVRVASVDHVGENLAEVHFNLEGLSNLKFEELPPDQAAAGMDVVLLGLPHKVSAKFVPDIMKTGARIVDLSGDFRLQDLNAYKKYYGGDHPSPQFIKDFVYGLPELNREKIKAARYVASPGCFATAMELALLPLAKAGWLQGEVEVVGLTGSSGSGIAPSAGTHHPTRAGNLRTYKPLEHQHIPEVTQLLHQAGARDVTLRFVPVSAPLVRGIFITAFAHVDASISADAIKKAYADTYKGEPFVRIPLKRLPEVAAVAGSNHAEVGLAIAEPANGKRLVTAFAAADNLIKGGAGQAIQSMNLMLGFDEKTTLEDPGSWP
jgi:N-acetyl-gamma-glutamyl-phosphate reductase